LKAAKTAKMNRKAPKRGFPLAVDPAPTAAIPIGTKELIILGVLKLGIVVVVI